MKLTKERLIEIIKEELELSSSPVEEVQKQTSDVTVIAKLLPRIDNIKEYEQLLNLVVDSPVKGVSDSQKKMLLKRLRDKINGVLSGASGAPEQAPAKEQPQQPTPQA